METPLEVSGGISGKGVFRRVRLSPHLLKMTVKEIESGGESKED